VRYALGAPLRPLVIIQTFIMTPYNLSYTKILRRLKEFRILSRYKFRENSKIIAIINKQ
jgi:hypothetical protein